MQEKLVIVPKKTTGGHKAGMIAFFVLTCLCLVLSMFVSPVMFMVPTIIFGVCLHFAVKWSMSIHIMMAT